ncbi:MAG: FMN-binding glutamate synthase family protein [Gemmatimonadota bacterium]|nr:FMN-binding glutamate synthase family protein [Gemmatimonadota bacterium]
MGAGGWTLTIVLGVLALTIAHDLLQKRHAILRNFPIIGHFRYWLEAIGPELRQYIVTSNNEERPFSRDQRRWVYASAKKENNYFAFGTDEAIELQPHYIIIKHSAFAPEPENGTPRVKGEPKRDFHPLNAEKLKGDYPIPCAKVLGAKRGRARAFRPSSAVNVSAMSYGSLSAAAIEALNRGVALADALHNTGEGGISPYHRNGGDLIWQIGTGYFGCRGGDGGFSKTRFLETVDANRVKAIEIKLSQGAKPGLGGVLPAAKVTREIAGIRGVPVGQDVISPSHHQAFADVDEMLDFVEELADSTGLPVGIKSAVGEDRVWLDLARLMSRGDRGVDFITIDGGEGGTGAAPLVFSDHVALPFKIGFTRAFSIFAREGVADDLVWIGSGKLGFPESALLAFSFGCDMIAVAREAMMAVGCIQAQRCHTGHCPTGVATQSKWLMRGLDSTSKAARLANYIVTLRKELLWLSRACGERHPGLVTGDHIEIIDGVFGARSSWDVFGYEDGWGLPAREDQRSIREIMASYEAPH